MKSNTEDQRTRIVNEGFRRLHDEFKQPPLDLDSKETQELLRLKLDEDIRLLRIKLYGRTR